MIWKANNVIAGYNVRIRYRSRSVRITPPREYWRVVVLTRTKFEEECHHFPGGMFDVDKLKYVRKQNRSIDIFHILRLMKSQIDDTLFQGYAIDARTSLFYSFTYSEDFTRVTYTQPIILTLINSVVSQLNNTIRILRKFISSRFALEHRYEEFARKSFCLTVHHFKTMFFELWALLNYLYPKIFTFKEKEYFRTHSS